MRAAALLALILSLSGADVALAQGVDPELARSFRLDFAVPESPAFNLLEVSESNILRPSNVRELSVAASQFVGSGADVTIPRAFAIEFAPTLILRGPRLTRSDYRKAPFLYRFRVSGATSRPEGGSEATMVAFGVRTTIVDGSDLRTNAAGESFRQMLTAAATTQVRAKALVDSTLAVTFGLNPVTASETTDSVFAASSRPVRLAALIGAGLSHAQAQEVLALFDGLTRPDLDRVRQVRDSLENALWNATVVDVAASILAQGQGDSPEDLRTQRWAVWGTAGFPVMSWGQFLLGARFAGQRNATTEDFDLDGSLSGRLYVGSNELKAFVEFQGTFQEEIDARVLLNSGGEFNVARIGWVSFMAGLEFDRESDTTDLVTDFTFNLAVP